MLALLMKRVLENYAKILFFWSKSVLHIVAWNFKIAHVHHSVIRQVERGKASIVCLSAAFGLFSHKLRATRSSPGCPGSLQSTFFLLYTHIHTRTQMYTRIHHVSKRNMLVIRIAGRIDYIWKVLARFESFSIKIDSKYPAGTGRVTGWVHLFMFFFHVTRAHC